MSGSTGRYKNTEPHALWHPDGAGRRGRHFPEIFFAVWHPEKNRYVLIVAIPGWQMIETRDCVIIDTEEYGLAAVLPIGRLPDLLLQLGGRPGGRLRRSEKDPMGYFLFGGSDIVMVFQDGVDVEFLCEAEGSGYAHMEMGEP